MIAEQRELRSSAPRASLLIRRLKSCAVGLLLLFPVVDSSAAPGTIEIYEHYGTYTLDDPPPDMRPIVLQVPNRFRYGSSKGSVRNWGLNILTYYPSLTSPEDPGNAKFGLNCIGLCNGRILVAVENRAHSISASGSPNMGDFIARATRKWELTPPYSPYVHVRKLRSPDGFDEGFERVTTPRSDAPLPHITSVERIYFRKAKDGAHFDLAAICQAGERTTCVLHFSLRCNPKIYVSVNGLDGSYLKMSQDIEDKVDQFVSSMVKSPPCAR
jgi:hypothetical protein